MLYQIAYVSLSKEPLQPKLLSDILNVSQRNNGRDGITGVLMYHDRIFFQVLEGERSVVESCYRRIYDDPRHNNFSIVLEDTIESLTFSDWAMGYAGPDEIRGHTKNSLQSLADLRDGEGAVTDRDSLALVLACKVFEKIKP